MIAVVQEAIYSKINGIVGLGAEVYDLVAPQDDASYPYVVVQPIASTDESTDTETEALRASFQIHTWSTDKSSLETMNIQKLIYDNLHLATDLAPTGYGVSIVRQESANIMLDPDGETRHGVQVYDIIFEPLITYFY